MNNNYLCNNMEYKDWNLWNNITFKTNAYRKNFDFVNDNENIITEYDGIVTKIRIVEKKLPFIVGEYGFSMWNIELGRKFDIDIEKLITEHRIENTYSELIQVIKDNDFNLKNLNKLILIHTFVLHKDYRKHGITEEFIEMIYRDFYCEKTAIIALVKPFQNNQIDSDYFTNLKSVQVKETSNSVNSHIPAIEYYNLDELIKKQDIEYNNYKLFSVANRCGFQRINDSYLFLLSPEKIIERMLKKQKHSKSIDANLN